MSVSMMMNITKINSDDIHNTQKKMIMISAMIMIMVMTYRLWHENVMMKIMMTLRYYDDDLQTLVWKYDDENDVDIKI